MVIYNILGTYYTKCREGRKIPLLEKFSLKTISKNIFIKLHQILLQHIWGDRVNLSEAILCSLNFDPVIKWYFKRMI